MSAQTVAVSDGTTRIVNDCSPYRLNKGEFPLIPVQKEEQSLVLELKTPKTIRMIWSKSYIREKKKRKLSHIEQLIGLKSSLKISCGKIDLTLSEINSTSLVCLYHHS